MEVLCTKHLEALPLSTDNLDTYLDRPPNLVPVEITKYTVTKVVGRPSGGAGPEGGRTQSSDLTLSSHPFSL